LASSAAGCLSPAGLAFLDAVHWRVKALIHTPRIRGGRSEDARTVIVPMHDELRVGTLHSIRRQAGITSHQLRELL
jgi:hypothetical protein